MKSGIRIALAATLLAPWWLGTFASATGRTATIHTFSFRLEGQQEVPSVNTGGTGWCTITLDDVTGAVSVTGEFGCLRGAVTAAHIHGPAPRGQNAGIIVGLNPSGSTSGTISGSGTLDAQQIQDMLNGDTYVNVHSIFSLTGEIRGQVEPCPPASVTSFNGGGTNPVILSSPAPSSLGATWTADLDASGHAPSVAVLWFYVRPNSGILTGAGEILVNLATKRLRRNAMAHSGSLVTFSYGVPNDTSLCGLRVYAQGAVLGSPGPQLSNRLNLTFGL